MDNSTSQQNSGDAQQIPPTNFPPTGSGIPPYPGYFAPPVQQLRVGFGKRLGAWFIDVIIVVLLSGIFSFALRGTDLPFLEKQKEKIQQQQESMQLDMSGADENMVSQIMDMSLMFGAMASIIGILYALVELFTGASPAKHMLGIQIAHDNGAAGDFALWAKRWIIKNSGTIIGFIGLFVLSTAIDTISTIVSFVIILGCFAAIGDERKALHDYIAKTAVFHKEDIGQVPQPAVA